ncbi:hypothetical protein [Paenibacillus sp. H1-7]|uniref:hypothetical protein n=1 Tax=Paenibacillus sp. H1-7 TaxID=2282849 RepID=UPI001EF820FA|nr:hypothetical protein [Paenibacillus sp. H1-7]
MTDGVRQVLRRYSRQLGEWCEANGLAFTGHYLWESALGVATRVAASIMPHYRHQHVPGIDMLSEQTDEQLTVKQCTSSVRASRTNTAALMSFPRHTAAQVHLARPAGPAAAASAPSL